MRITRITTLVALAVSAIAIAPTAAAAPTGPPRACVTSGAATTCQTPGNVEIINSTPARNFYPYGRAPYLLGGN